MKHIFHTIRHTARAATVLLLALLAAQTAGAQEDVSNAAGLAAAFNDPTVSVVNVTKDITGVGDLSLNRALTINLNGHTISGDELYIDVGPGRSLTINGGGGNIISGKSDGPAIYNRGTVTLSHVDIITYRDNAINGDGTLNIGYNVSFKYISDIDNAAGLVAAYDDTNVGVINVTDNITGVGGLLPLNHSLTINLNGHTISGDGLHFDVYTGLSLTINGGGQDGSVGNIISGYADGPAINNDGTVTLSNVNITTYRDNAINGDGTLNIGDNVSFISDIDNAYALAEAFNNPNVGVINVTDNITGVGGLSLDRNLTINLNGHTISSDELHFDVGPGHSLTINGGGQGGSVGNIISSKADGPAIDNYGTVTLSHVNITTNYDFAIRGTGMLYIGNNVSFNGWTEIPFRTPNVNTEDGNYNYDPGKPLANVVATVTVGGKAHYFENSGAALTYIVSHPDNDHFSLTGTTYTIHTATGWDAFCSLLADNDKGFFDGKTVQLGADIGTADDPVTSMAGASGKEFTGTFDGQGNTLTFSHTATDNYCAPFRTVQGATAQTPAVISNLNVVSTVTADDYRHPAGLIALQSGYVSVTDCNVEAHINCTKGTVNTYDLYPAALVSQSNNTGVLTVSGCTTTGQIATDGKYAAGLVGIVQGTASISDCISSVTIQSTTSGDGTHGGIVALNSGTLSINGCVFDGKLLSTGTNATTNCGGFVGYGNGTITNSLYAPADLVTGETEVQTGDVNNHPSATFARDNATVTNSYYTRTLGTAQGKQAHSIAAGEGVTLGYAGEATEYSVSGITAYRASGASGDDDPFIAGLVYNEVLYAGDGDAVSLTLANSSGDAPLGYYYPYSVSAGTLSGSTLTMPAADVTVSVNTEVLRSTGVAVEVSYVDAGGTARTDLAIALDGHEAVDDDGNVNLAAGTYYVGTDITYANRIYLYGDVTLILADGKTMTLNDDTPGIYGGYNLTIYGQSLDAATAGTLRYNGTADGITVNNYEQHSGNVSITTIGSTIDSWVRGIYASVTLRGGTLTVTADGTNAIAIIGGTHSILGGQLTATATGISATGIYASADGGTLGCTTASDFIYVSSYRVGPGGRLNIADGQTLFDEYGNYYSGNGVTIPGGKTLRLYGIALTAREAPDGNYWTTYYNSTLGFTIDDDENACAYTATYGDGQLTLHYQGNEIPAGTAVIIVAENSVVSMTAAPDLDDFNAPNDLRGVDVDTPTSALGTGTFYVLGKTTVGGEQHFGFHRYTGEEMAARKAFLHVPGSSNARALDMVFANEETGIGSIESGELRMENFYTLDGRKLNGKPTKPGLYINNGRKVVIK